MQISKRDFLKKLGFGGAALATGVAFGDEATGTPCAGKGMIGDPLYSTCKAIRDIPKMPVDVPSAFLKDGKVVQPVREVPVFHETDVVVVGGGPAGFAAALASARTGAKTMLIERYGSLGGLFTNGLVLIIVGSAEGVRGGEQRLVTRGVCGEFMKRCEEMGKGAYFTDARHGPYQPTIDPEAAKVLMDRMVRSERNLEVLFHCWGVDVIQDGNAIRGVVFESKQGRQAILAKQVVDCSGDADMLFRAGGDYCQITHGIGHVVRLGNMDRVTAKTAPVGPDGKRLSGKWPTRSNEGNPSLWWGNTDPGPKGNGLDVRDLTGAEIGFRKEWFEHVRVMRKTPGWEEVFIANTCSQIGPRATRLVDAEVVLSRKDLDADPTFPDTIGWCGSAAGHPAHPVPYRALVPKKVDNVLCAGRCIGTGDSIDTFRLIGPCFVTGQAAGVAAALSAKKGIAPRALAYADLRRALDAQRVFI